MCPDEGSGRDIATLSRGNALGATQAARARPARFTGANHDMLHPDGGGWSSLIESHGDGLFADYSASYRRVVNGNQVVELLDGGRFRSHLQHHTLRRTQPDDIVGGTDCPLAVEGDLGAALRFDRSLNTYLRCFRPKGFAYTTGLTAHLLCKFTNADPATLQYAYGIQTDAYNVLYQGGSAPNVVHWAAAGNGPTSAAGTYDGSGYFVWSAEMTVDGEIRLLKDGVEQDVSADDDVHLTPERVEEIVLGAYGFGLVDGYCASMDFVRLTICELETEAQRGALAAMYLSEYGKVFAT